MAVLDDAKRIYKKLLGANPNHADSLHLMGLIEQHNRKYADAAALIGRAIALNPGQALYHSNLGTVFQAQGELDEAVACYRRTLALKPDLVEAQRNLGVALAAQNRVADAIAAFERSFVLNPYDAHAYNNLGLTLQSDNRLADAVYYYRQAVSLQPNFAEAMNNLGNALQAQDKLDEAEASYRLAINANPAFLAAYNNLGNSLQMRNQMDEAVTCYRRALEIDPDFAQAQFSLALAQLADGNCSDGWTNFEARWRTPGHVPMRAYPKPLWSGENISRGKLLVWGEQGVGDEVMFAGLIPDLISRGVDCILDCEARLKPLFTRSFPSVQVTCGYRLDDNIAAHLPSGSLPRHANPSTAAYLVPDQSLRAEFRAHYSIRSRHSKDKPIVGLAWHTINKKTGPRRSIPFPLLEPLISNSGASWISLQYGNHGTAEGLFVDETVEQFVDLDRFAAQIAALDLVITIDNSTAHLAGALGVPVWLLLPFAADWRWMRTGGTSRWYQIFGLHRIKRRFA